MENIYVYNVILIFIYLFSNFIKIIYVHKSPVTRMTEGPKQLEWMVAMMCTVADNQLIWALIGP